MIKTVLRKVCSPPGWSLGLLLMKIRYHGSSSSIKCHVYHHFGGRRHTPVVCNESREPHTSHYTSNKKNFKTRFVNIILTQFTTYQLDTCNKILKWGNIIMWGICGVCTLALTVAKTSSHYDRFAISVPARSLLLFDLA